MGREKLKTGKFESLKKVRAIILILLISEILFSIISTLFMKNGNIGVSIIFNIIGILVLFVCFIFTLKWCSLSAEQKNENKNKRAK